MRPATRRAKFVVVGMVEQAGTGASAAAPMVRAVYNGLLGVGQPAALPSSTPVSQLPKIDHGRRDSTATAGADRAAGARTAAARRPLLAPPAVRIGADAMTLLARDPAAPLLAGPLASLPARARIGSARVGVAGDRR